MYSIKVCTEHLTQNSRTIQGCRRTKFEVEAKSKGTTTSSNYHKLLPLQKRALRAVEGCYGAPQNLRTQPLFVKHCILQVDQVYYLRLLQYIHRNRLYSVTDRIINYNFREVKLRVPRTRANYGRQKLNFQVPKALNKFPFTDDFFLSENVFKKNTKRRLIEGQIQM